MLFLQSYEYFNMFLINAVVDFELPYYNVCLFRTPGDLDKRDKRHQNEYSNLYVENKLTTPRKKQINRKRQKD